MDLLHHWESGDAQAALRMYKRDRKFRERLVKGLYRFAGFTQKANRAIKVIEDACQRTGTGLPF